MSPDSTYLCAVVIPTCDSKLSPQQMRRCIVVQDAKEVQSQDHLSKCRMKKLASEVDERQCLGLPYAAKPARHKGRFG